MKVLELDIETAPSKAYIWDLKTRYVPIQHVVEPGYTLCFAARWEGQARVIFRSIWKDGHKKMCNDMWELLDEADVVVHFNGKKFDIPTLNKEFIKLGFIPPSNYKQIDLYPVVKKQFRFLSSSMNHVCEELGLKVKIDTKGMPLWTGVMAGVKKDQRLMRSYNINDIDMLRELYLAMQPWIPRHPNRGLYMTDPSKMVCPNCGSAKLRFKRYEYPASINAYKGYKCLDCGANPRARLPDHSKKRPAMVST